MRRLLQNINCLVINLFDWSWFMGMRTTGKRSAVVMSAQAQLWPDASWTWSLQQSSEKELPLSYIVLREVVQWFQLILCKGKKLVFLLMKMGIFSTSFPALPVRSDWICSIYSFLIFNWYLYMVYEITYQIILSSRVKP